MRNSKAALRKQMRRAEDSALAEVEWFFTRAEGKVPDPGEASLPVRRAAARIQGWLSELATFHAGALSLRFTPRTDWPQTVRAEFGDYTSLVVRLACAAHPSGVRVDTTTVETAAVHRLEQMVAAKWRPSELTRLERHAIQHVRAALRAYVGVRGLRRSVVPVGQEVSL